jgi:hypothetical protein
MKGSCLCGAVVYEIDRLAGPIGHCHCRTCRKAHGAPFTATARVDRAHFRWLAGERLVSAFESSPGKLRRFCSRCGTHLVAEWRVKPHVILRVATLDDDPGSRPVAHIWTSHDVAWLAYGAELLSFPEAPVPAPDTSGR